MSYLREAELSPNFPPFAFYRDWLGAVPNIVRAQSLLPRAIEAQAVLEGGLLRTEKALPCVLKEQILLVVAASRGDIQTVALHRNLLSGLGVSALETEDLLRNYRQAGLSSARVALIDYCLKVSHWGPWVQAADVEDLRRRGLDDDSIQEAVLATGLASYYQALGSGLGVVPDYEPGDVPARKAAQPPRMQPSNHGTREKVSFLHSVYRSPKTFSPFELILSTHGFIPNFFRAQTARPELLEAEAKAVVGILHPEDVLDRKTKEYILLAVSAANLNSYCVAVHCNLLRGLGIAPEEGDQIALDYREANLPAATRAMLDFSLKITQRPLEVQRSDIDRLRSLEFSDEQILEGVVTTALNNWANTVQMGLGIEPDFEPPRAFEKKKMYQVPAEGRPTDAGTGAYIAAVAAEDPDAAQVAEAQRGNLDAFETLARSHARRVYRILMAILGNSDEAQDASQDVFLSAFKNLGRFQGRSKFSTWLVSIARNTAIQRLRDRRDLENLDEGADETGEEFRPRQVRAWQEDPEQLYSAVQRRGLVEKAILRLPANYRVVLMLRDIEQLSIEEVAQNLGLSSPATKARLLRGRLMLREALTPHFAAGAGRAAT